jgi:hypothetical protein
MDSAMKQTKLLALVDREARGVRDKNCRRGVGK